MVRPSRRRRAWAIVATLCTTAVLAMIGVITSDPHLTVRVPPAVLDPGLRGPAHDPDGSPDGPATAGAAARGGVLEVRFTLPSRLLAGNAQQFHLEVSGPRGRLLDDDVLLEIRLETDLDPRVRGVVWVTPPALLIPVAALRSRPLEIGSSQALPCDVEPGSLRITVRTLDVDGPQGDASGTIPVWPCTLQASPVAPGAPASVHIEVPVCGEHWRADLATLIAGDTPPARWCRPDDAEPEPDPEPTDPEPTDPEPSDPEPTPSPPPTQPAPPTPSPPPDPPPAEPEPRPARPTEPTHEDGDDNEDDDAADGDAADGDNDDNNDEAGTEAPDPEAPDPEAPDPEAPDPESPTPDADTAEVPTPTTGTSVDS